VVAQCAHLGSDIKELSHHALDKVRVAKQVSQVAALTGAFIFHLFSDTGETGPKYKQRPDKDNRPHHEIRGDDSHGLRLQVLVKPTRSLQGVDPLRTQFDAGKDE